MKNPREPEGEDELDEALEESFPASDPPSHGHVTPSPDEDDDAPDLDPPLPH